MKCSVCQRTIDINRSGLCDEHYRSTRRAERIKRDAEVIRLRIAGESVDDIAERFDLSPTTVRGICIDMPAKIPTRRLADLIASACGVAAVSREELLGKCKQRHLIVARQAVCLLGMKAGHSSTVVGRALNRDHTTVIHGRDAAKERAKRDPDYRKMLDSIWSGKQTAHVRAAPPPPRPVAPQVKVDRDYDMEHAAAVNNGIALGSASLLAALRAAA